MILIRGINNLAVDLFLVIYMFFQFVNLLLIIKDNLKPLLNKANFSLLNLP